MGSHMLRWVGRACLVLGVTALLLTPAALASAQTYPTQPTNTTGTTDPCLGTGGVVTHVNGLTFCTTSQVQGTSTPSGSLAFTGGNIALLVGLAVLIVGAGFVLVRLSRRPEVTR